MAGTRAIAIASVITSDDKIRSHARSGIQGSMCSESKNLEHPGKAQNNKSQPGSLIYAGVKMTVSKAKIQR